MAQNLTLLVAVSIVLVFAGFGAFFLCFVCLQQQGTDKALTPVERTALDLASQAVRLDDLRLWMFLEWLRCHCHQLPVQWVGQEGEEIRKYLNWWLGTFAPDDLHSEQQLITNEICWWRDADEKTLLRCLSNGFAGRDLSR